MSRRGVSPILGVIILIGIALAGGVLLSNISINYFNTAFSDIEYQITELSMQKDSGGSCYLFVTLYNSGSEPITSTTIEISSDARSSFNMTNSTTIVPGVSFMNLTKFRNLTNPDNPCTYVSDQSYSVEIHGSSNNSSFATTSLVKVKEVTRS